MVLCIKKKPHGAATTLVCQGNLCLMESLRFTGLGFLGILGLGFPSTLPEGSQGLVDLETENTLCFLIGPQEQGVVEPGQGGGGWANLVRMHGLPQGRTDPRLTATDLWPQSRRRLHAHSTCSFQRPRT